MQNWMHGYETNWVQGCMCGAGGHKCGAGVQLGCRSACGVGNADTPVSCTAKHQLGCNCNLWVQDNCICNHRCGHTSMQLCLCPHL